MEGGLGEWYYPNGLAIGLNQDGDGLYISRDQMAISLNRRGDATIAPGGVYCCVVPTTRGQETMCINLGRSYFVLSRKLFHSPLPLQFLPLLILHLQW